MNLSLERNYQGPGEREYLTEKLFQTGRLLFAFNERAGNRVAVTFLRENRDLHVSMSKILL